MQTVHGSYHLHCHVKPQTTKILILVVCDQTLIEIHKGNKQGCIPKDYVSAFHDFTHAKDLLDYDVWYFIRYIGSKISKYLASFSAV